MAHPETDDAPKRNWRGPSILLGVFLLCALLVALPASARKTDLFTITITDIVTNSAGVAEVIVELRNEADDASIEPKVQVALEEEYGTTNRVGQLHKMRWSSQPPWMAEYMEGEVVKLHVVKSFAVHEAEIRSSAGTNLHKGEVATLRFDRPGEKSFRLLVDVWRAQVPPKSSFRQRLEKWNAWANAKIHLPIIFSGSTWRHMQVSTPVIASQDTKSGEKSRFLGQKFEIRP